AARHRGCHQPADQPRLEPPPAAPRGRQLVAHDHQPAGLERAPDADVALVAQVVDLARAHRTLPRSRASLSGPGAPPASARVSGLCGTPSGAEGASPSTRRNAASTLSRRTPSSRICSPAARAVANTRWLVAVAGRSISSAIGDVTRHIAPAAVSASPSR